MTIGGERERQKPDEIKRLNDTKQFYYTAEYQGHSCFYWGFMDIMSHFILMTLKYVSEQPKTSHSVLRS